MRRFCLLILVVLIFVPLSSHAQESGQVITPENADQLQLVQTLGRGKIIDADWSPDGEWFGVRTSRGVWLYPANDLSSAPELAIRTDATSMEFNPATGELWTAHRDGTLTRWQMPDGMVLERYQVAEYQINRLTFSLDGSHLAFVVTEPQERFEPVKQTIILQDTATQNTLAEIVPEIGYHAAGIVFTDRYLITNLFTISDGFADSIIEFRDISTGELQPFENVPYGASIAVSPDGQTLFTYGVGEMSLLNYYQYDIQAQSEPSIWVDEGFLPTGPLIVSPDNQTIYFADDSDLYQYDIATRQTSPIRSFAHPIASLDFTPTGTLMIIGRDGSNILLHDNGMEFVSAHFDAPIRDMVIVENGVAVLTRTGSLWRELYSRRYQGNLLMFDAESGERRYRGTLNAYSSLAATSNGSIIATATEAGTVWFLDVLTGEGLSLWAVNDCPLISLTFSPDDSEIIAGAAKVPCDPPILLQIGVIDSATLDVTTLLERPLEGDSAPDANTSILSLAYSPNGEMVAIGTHGALYIWDGEIAFGYEMPVIVKSSATSSPISTLQLNPNGEFREIAFSPSGDFIVTTGFILAHGGLVELPIYVYDISTDTLAEIDAHSRPITGLAISSDSRLIASSSQDSTVRLWDSASLEMVHEIPMLGGANDVQFSADGTKLFIAGNDGTVRIWAIE